MSRAARFPFLESHPLVSMPYLTLILSAGSRHVEASGLLDTGATVNVLPHPLGIALGFAWEQEKTEIRLTGNLAELPARAILVTATVSGFAPVRLAFAWTQATSVPLILGQVNFFAEFDVCFFRSRSCFEVVPKRST